MKKKVIGIIGAMDEEIASLLNKMDQVRPHACYGIRFYRGTLEGTSLVLCKSGVGKVNAALCTQILIDRFQVQAIIFTGVAGALDSDLDIGDLVVSTECQQHDVDASVLGFPRGTIPFQEVSIFPADPDLVRWAVDAGKSLNHVKIVPGKVLSGDQFISDPAKVLELREQLKGACVEMEGAAVAHVSWLAGVPYVVIRSISDRADHSAHVNFAEFTRLAASRSSEMVCRLLALRQKEMKKSV
ncbi:5'-methylthioadenosine/adenosylhomocysteine nucleosidase [Thermoactinomyces mirandus]|uniref:adenosylhomocysteine nucleosidase n=1 Tax=Thermoactinomyces mirandus TaxID=2756294 RepID=A0A7W1XQM9_9BACL|nr:5'-methylthioadenosine/adenosylhomocysteine nucleosidase [Thermoactinomyces mirandus]MBA4601469.1 5'-methylthioadenosine/adenosylhomocysteine nucleosidase [Thermoactinomyces mirandus]